MKIKHVVAKPGTGEEKIAAERERQINIEGFDAEHDKKTTSSHQLKIAALCYVLADGEKSPKPPEWPWTDAWWKPKDTETNLIRAGALFLAAADMVYAKNDTLGLSRIEKKMLKDSARLCAEAIDKIKRY